MGLILVGGKRVDAKKEKGFLKAPKKTLPEMVESGLEEVTKELLVAAAPLGKKHLINDQLVDQINGLIKDPELRYGFRDNLLGYINVLQHMTCSIKDYVNAVKFVSFRLLGNSNYKSYVKTFPERYQRLKSEGFSEDSVRGFVSAYTRNKLVTGIFEQTLIPSYVLNQDLYQQALNVQADLMLNAKSEKVRSDAANSILNHLKLPETQKVSLDLNIKQDESIIELRRTTMELVKRQKEMLETGTMKTHEIATQKIISGIAERV
jgi:hypothetical protein